MSLALAATAALLRRALPKAASASSALALRAMSSTAITATVDKVLTAKDTATGVATITLNAPPVNTFSLEFATEL
jgi:hypothetical protein